MSAFDFLVFEKRGKELEDWLRKEFSLLRTGRASQAMLDNIMVSAYGSAMPVSHVANISIEDSRTLRIIPFDKGQLKAIEDAIRLSSTGFSVSSDESGIRLNAPDLTSERRAQVIKLLREKLEEARITLRKEREEVLGEFKKKKQDGEMSEDEFFKGRDTLQKLVDEINQQFEGMATRKEKEIEG